MSPIEKVISPITEYPRNYEEMRKEAEQQISRGAEQVMEGAFGSGLSGDLPKFAGGLGNVALGALGYVGSPISAAYRSLIGQPVEDVTGIPREQTEFAAQLATPGIGLTRLAKAPGIPAEPVAAPGFRTAPQAPPPIPGSREDVIAAANRLSETGSPVQIPRAAASDLPGMQQAGQVVSNVPIAGLPMVKAAEKSIAQMGTKADEIAQLAGSVGTKADTGTTARNSITDWITGESKVAVDKAYGKVDQLINKNITTSLENTADLVSQISARRTAAGQETPGKAIDTVLAAVQRPGGLTYDGIKQLRTAVGEMLNRGILPADISGAELEQIYGALSNDLKTSVAASGPEAKSAFDRANKYYSLVSDRRKAMAKIVGAEGNAPPEQVFSKLMAMASDGPRADITKLAQARKVMGSSDWDEVASSAISQLGRDVEDNFSPQRFITGYNKLSDAGKNILFNSTDKALKAHLDDINTVSSRFKQLQRFSNPSGTARNLAGSAELYGLWNHPLTTIASLLGSGTLSVALSRPAQAASIAKWMRSNYELAQNPTARTIAKYGINTRNMLSTIGEKNVTPQDFIAAARTGTPGQQQSRVQ